MGVPISITINQRAEQELNLRRVAGSVFCGHVRVADTHRPRTKPAVGLEPTAST